MWNIFSRQAAGDPEQGSTTERPDGLRKGPELSMKGRTLEY